MKGNEQCRNTCIMSCMYRIDATATTVYVFISFIMINFCGFYSRVVLISFSSAQPIPSLMCRRERSSIEWLLDRQGNSLVVADWFTLWFLVCFALCKLVNDEFLCVHVLLKYSSHPLQLLHVLNLRAAFITPPSMCEGVATVRERLLHI